MRAFRTTLPSLKRKLVDLLRDLKRQGRSIAAYGAAAKGTTLLNYCGLGAGELDYVVDRSPVKQGLLTPGTLLADLSHRRSSRDHARLRACCWSGISPTRSWRSRPSIAAAADDLLCPVPEPRIV